MRNQRIRHKEERQGKVTTEDKHDFRENSSVSMGTLKFLITVPYYANENKDKKENQ